jgi:O-acetyl-ADP-ribose deacetylase (regulator of RNase III)
MSVLKVIKGNIFGSKCQTIVNTVNCVGVMGAGLALECKLRYPEMNAKYVQICEKKLLDIGKLWLFKSPERWILNFPTKKHWKYPSKEEYLHAGLRRFLDTYLDKNITSVAFPLLGAQHGGINSSKSEEIMVSYLSRCRIPIEIYHYDPAAVDDLYVNFKSILLRMTAEEIKEKTGLRANYVRAVVDALQNPSITQLGRLASIKGIGATTLERLFRFATQEFQQSDCTVHQPWLEL